jgi:hypothetical protein
MRNIDKRTQEAFWGRGTLRLSNTEVITYWNPEVRVDCYLHNNKIAELLGDRWLSISNAGYYTDVTKNRLNAILHYLHDVGIHGSKWTFWFKKTEYCWPLHGRHKLIVDLITREVRPDRLWMSEQIYIGQTG